MAIRGFKGKLGLVGVVFFACARGFNNYLTSQFVLQFIVRSYQKMRRYGRGGGVS